MAIRYLFFYLSARLLIYLVAFLVVGVYLSQHKNDFSYFFGSQIFLLIVSFFILSRQGILGNQKIKNLDFLLGNNFTQFEKKKNLKLLAIYYSIFILLLILLVDLNVVFYFNNLTNTFLLIMISVISIFYVYLKTTSLKIKNQITFQNKYPWVLQYLFIWLGTYVFIVFNKNEISLFNINKTNSQIITMIILLSLLMYMIIDIFKKYLPFISDKNTINSNHFFNRLTFDFIEKNIRGSAIWLFAPALVLRYFSISPLSKTLIISIISSLLLTPNFISKPILNYKKLIGLKAIKKVVYKSAFIAWIFIITIQFIQFLVLGVSIKYLFFLNLSSTILFITRPLMAILLIQNSINENKKMDYYAFFMLITLMILAVGAYYAS
ncbi:MAG: hypothetical protein LBC17_03655 [Lactobacillaceae bacterium]|nr:hypothetical protein [Lactobacillaceae bacterium]